MFKDPRFYVAVGVTSLLMIILTSKVLVKLPKIGALFTVPSAPPSP